MAKLRDLNFSALFMILSRSSRLSTRASRPLSIVVRRVNEMFRVLKQSLSTSSREAGGVLGSWWSAILNELKRVGGLVGRGMVFCTG